MIHLNSSRGNESKSKEEESEEETVSKIKSFKTQQLLAHVYFLTSSLKTFN